MNAHLTDEDRADLAQLLRDLIEADRFFPRAKRVRRWKELLGKLDPWSETDASTLPSV